MKKLLLLSVLFAITFSVFSQTTKYVKNRRTGLWDLIVNMSSTPTIAVDSLQTDIITTKDSSYITVRDAMSFEDSISVGGSAYADSIVTLNYAIGNLSYVIKSADYTATATDYAIEFTTASTLTLPAGYDNAVFEVFNCSSGNVTIDGNGAEQIGNASTSTTFTMSTGESYLFKWNGTYWRVR